MAWWVAWNILRYFHNISNLWHVRGKIACESTVPSLFHGPDSWYVSSSIRSSDQPLTLGRWRFGMLWAAGICSLYTGQMVAPLWSSAKLTSLAAGWALHTASSLVLSYLAGSARFCLSLGLDSHSSTCLGQQKLMAFSLKGWCWLYDFSLGLLYAYCIRCYKWNRGSTNISLQGTRNHIITQENLAHDCENC